MLQVFICDFIFYLYVICVILVIVYLKCQKIFLKCDSDYVTVFNIN